MPTDQDILTLSQMFSPAFPVGAFAYSHGLEWAIDCGDVTDPASTKLWVETVLEHGAGRNDCIFLAVAYRADAAEALTEIDDMCRAFAPSRERLKESDLQGAAFCDVLRSVWGADLHGLCYPVAAGKAARALNLPLELTARMYLQSFASNLVAAAMRLVPLGQTDGQRIIHELTPLVSKIAGEALEAGLDDLSSTAFLSDIASMKHETQYSRIFRT
jgi:urease accessory protein